MSDQSSNPFAPKGLQQAAAAQDGSKPFAPRTQRTAGDAPFEQGQAPNPFAPKSWYTGANMEGVDNGYSTPFFQKFFEQQDALSKSGKLQDFFNQKDATGIVTWDHGKDVDGKSTKFKFGDVYENGKLVANVYQTYDKATADLLMADLTLDADTKAKAFKQGTPEAIGDEVQSKRRATEKETAAFLTQKDFGDKVTKQHEEWDTGVAQGTTFAAGVAGGAAVGFGAGTVVPGLGNVVGTIAGAVVGGAGALLNQDELINQAARAKVTQDMANEQFGRGAGFFTGLQQWGGLGMKAISPVSNVLHGAYDAAGSGDVGDREVGWYRTDAEGQRVRNGAMQVADVGASLIDAAGQFGSKAGALVFQGAMGASVAGQVGQLPTTGMRTFDDRSATFDKIYQNDDGDFDLGSLSAGIGSIAIDTVQLGMARGLTNAATSASRVQRATLGEAPAMGTIATRLRAITGADRVHAGGFSFLLDDAGRVAAGSKVRPSLSILAPSEAIQGLSAGMRARRAAAVDNGAVTSDMFYQAANQMAAGSRTWNAALVNGFGEGTEEALQAVLEPLSHNAQIDPEQVWLSFQQGFGMGAGMTVGAAARGVTADERLYAQAYIVQGALNQTQLTKSEWDAMTQQEKSAATMAPAPVMEAAREAAAKARDDQAASAVANTPALEKYVDSAQRAQEREAGKITTRTDGAFVITQQRDAGVVDIDGRPDAGSMPNHAVGSSFSTLLENFVHRMNGLQIQLDSLPEGDPMIPVLQAASTEGTQMFEFLAQTQAQIDGALEAGAMDAVAQAVTSANATLRSWFDGDGTSPEQIDARRRAVSQLFIRDPQDQAGSYQLLLPQASIELTRESANNVLQVSHGILQAIGGDYDGDKIRAQAQVILDPAKFENLRTGMNLLGAMGADGGAVNIMARPYEVYEVAQMSKALQGSGPLHAEAQGVLDRIVQALSTRYAESAIPAADLKRVLERFRRDIRDNDGKARARLIDSLAVFGEEMSEFARRSLTNEWLWVDQVVQANLQRFQRISAAHTPAPGELNTTRKPPIAQTTQFRSVAADAAATDAMTMSLQTAGHSLFRMFQKLHYSSWNAPVEGTIEGNVEGLTELTALYEELSQGMTRTVLDALDAQDEVMARVQHQLRALAADARQMANETGAQLDGASALALVANITMPWADNKGTIHTGTTAAQALLAREIIRAKAEHAASMTPELASKYARYDRMTRPGQGEQAFVEVMGSVQLYELLGPAAQALGSNLTVEQYVRQYVNQSEQAKTDTARLLRMEPEYLGRESTQNLPYSLEEATSDSGKNRRSAISGYTSVIDSIIGAGNKRLTVDDKGHATGELGERSDTYQTTLEDGFRQAHLAIAELEKMRRGLNRKKPEEARKWLAVVMNSNPEWARSVMALIPDTAVNAVMQVQKRGGKDTLFISPWVYDMLLMTDPKEAAMHYWRNLTLARWAALGGNSTAAETDSKARTFASLDSRFQRLLYRTQLAGDRGISMAKLMDRLMKSTDLDSFFQYVNTEHRQSEAPYMAWIDDVAELSPDKASGGLSSAMPGALIRESISDFAMRSERMAVAISDERKVQIADDRTMTALSRAIADGDKASEPDKIMLARAKEVLDFAKEQRTTLGPGAMRAMTMGSLLHFFGQAHTKGISPWPYVPIGAFEALGDSLGFKTPFGQHEAAVVGTQDAEDIGGNMPMAARDSLESMTADGTPITWEQLTIEKLVQVYRDRPDAAPAIRAILFPSVRERTEYGQVTQQFLTGKSITELLEKRTYEDLLAPTRKDRAIYLSMIEARSKNFGGNYPVMRLANEMVIARSSSLRQGLTPQAAEVMVEKVYDEIAQALQVVGEIAALDPTVRTTALGELKTALRKRIRNRQAGAMLGLEGKDADDLTTVLFDQLIQSKRAEVLEQVAAASTEAEAEGLQADFESLVKKVELILSDTPFEQVAAAFALPWDDAPALAQKQQEIIEYVRTHPYLMTKASWAKTELRELTSWIIEPSPLSAAPELDRKTWDTISRAIVGTYLDEMSTDTADGVSVPVYPDAKKEAQLKYWDPTYSYLFNDLLDPDGPLALAAAEIHTASGRRGVRNATGSLVNLLLETIYAPGSLGPWTSDIPRLSIEAGSRLDASAAADAVAMAGLSPRNEASESAATRRTFAIPPAEAFSVATIDLVTLQGNQSSGMVDTTLAGVPTPMPLMRMNGRFARGATLEYVDADGQPQSVDLWNTRPALGRTHRQDPTAANSGLRSLTVNQLRAIVGRNLPEDAVGARVMVDFVHPDAQPATGYAHNLFFEGTSFELDADSLDSLNATLWFAPGSISPNEQAKALQANKSGKPALEVTDTMLSAARAEHENGWETDFAGMLSRKTMYLMTHDLGSGRLQPAFFNAVFKRQKMRHFVRGFAIAEDGSGNGAPELWSAERVIEFQRANPGVPLPLASAQLWKPSSKVLRSMLGEGDAEGALVTLTGQPELDISKIPVWDGDTNTIVQRMPGALATTAVGQFATADLLDTPAAQRTFQSQLALTPPVGDARKTAYERALRTVDARRTDIHAARQSVDRYAGSLSAQNARAMNAGGQAMSAPAGGIDGRSFGLPFIGPRNIEDTRISDALFSELNEALNLSGLRAAWIFQAGPSDNHGPIAGILNEVSLGNAVADKGPRHLQLAPSDIVVVDLTSFDATYSSSSSAALKAGEAALEHMMKAHSIIALPDGTTGGDLRHNLGQYLREHNYRPISGSKHLFEPMKSSEIFATPRARMTTLTETHAISAQSTVTVFHSREFPIAENAAMILNPGERHPVAVAMDLVPVNLFDRFNVPIESAQVLAVQQTLLNLDPPTKAMLYDSMGVEPGSAEARDFDAALQRLLDNWDADPTNPMVTPRRGADFGTGDIIPLLDAKTGDILLLRHGHELPDATLLREQLTKAAVAGERRRGIAVSSPKVNANHTTRRGQVIEFQPRSQYGLTAMIRVPLQEYGDKLQLEGNGMKLVTSELARGIKMPEHGLFEDWHLDLATNWDDTTSKESFLGLVDNFRHAIAFFGADFRGELVEALFGLDLETLSPQNRVDTLSVLNEVLLAVQNGQTIDVAVAHDLMRAQAPGAFLTELFVDVAPAVGTSIMSSTWLADISAPNATPAQQIARGILLYLATPQGRVEHVLESGGFNAPGARTGNGKSIMMPQLFTNMLDRAAFGSPLRTHMLTKINDQIYNPVEGQGYRLAEDLSFHVESSTGTYSGWLQFSEAHSSGDNPVTNDMAFARSSDQKVSEHSLDIAFQAIGARTAIPKALSKTAAWHSREGIETWEKEGALWNVLGDLPKNDTTYLPWRALTPAEDDYKDLGRGAVSAFRQSLSQEGWTPKEVADFEALRIKVVLAFGLKEKQAGIVDFWIRTMLGQPLGEGDAGRITHRNAMETMELELLWNATNGYLPTHGAEVPQITYNDLSVLHRAAEKRGPSGFQLREGLDSREVVTSWDDWVHVALAIGETEHQLFDPMFRLATDGAMHTFIDAGGSLVGDVVTRNALLRDKLLDPETSKLVLSIDPTQQTLLNEAPLLDRSRVTLDSIMGGQRMAGGKVSMADVPASVRARRTAARRKWRKENNVPQPMPMSLRNFRETGSTFINETTTTSSILRILTNLRVGNALFNPFLWVSAVAETVVRGGLEDVTNFLMGDSTTLAGGITSRYSAEERKGFKALTHVLGSRTDFKGMVYRELHFQNDRLMNAGRIERWTHNFAKFGSSIQDPTYGMRGDVLARHYLEAVLAYMASTPMDTAMSPAYVTAKLSTEVTFVRDSMPQAHAAAMATIANIRSLKPTVMSLMARGVYEPLSQNPNLLIALPSTLFLKLPLMFSGYAMNVATTLLGLQGANAAIAAMFDGRKTGFIGRIQAAMRGVPYDSDETFDMSEVLEGIDLSKAFIQGGVTHTSLFALGMLSGGLNLSGEDEEDRRRRRMAQVQGAGYVYDPRKIENDFRNADAAFMDWLPFGLDSMFRVTDEDSPSGQKSMATLHWTLKQFISPLIGMEKFFNTGDPRQIVWGFQEAISSFPLINSASWADATATFAELSSQAAEHEALGTPDDLSTAFDFMMKGVWTMERMLFENAFINMLYVGADKYDRDQYKTPMTDSSGEIQRFGPGQTPRPTEMMNDYIDPETGEVKSGYVTRDYWDAQVHGMAENRATLAVLGSLFTGLGDSTMLRTNMVAKTRTIEKPELTEEQAIGLVLSEWDNRNVTINTTVDDVVYSENGSEVLTEAGARAVFQGLWKKSVSFGDPSLEGVFIPYEMRKNLQAKMMADITQEGIDLGLTESKAKSRMYNIWNGPSTDPNVPGLAEILWSDQISFAKNLKYNQLNTTYTTGPDGMPWATGVTRDSIHNAFGLMPLNRYYAGDVGRLGVDSRLNAVDAAAGLNTGLRGLERIDETWYTPTAEEIAEELEKGITKALQDSFSNSGTGKEWEDFGSGWKNFGRRGGYRRGGGGGGGYSSGGTFTKLNAPQDSNVPYDNSIPFINTSTPIIRRATIRRERFDSDRGRLNQWQ